MVSQYLNSLLKEISYAISGLDFTVHVSVTRSKDIVVSNDCLNFWKSTVSISRFSKTLLRGTAITYVTEIPLPLYYGENSLELFEGKVWLCDFSQDYENAHVTNLRIDECVNYDKVNEVFRRHGISMDHYMYDMVQDTYWKNIQSKHLSESDYMIPDDE